MCIPEISKHTFWSSGSGNILSANNFQRLNKGIAQGKKQNIFLFSPVLAISLYKPLLSNNGGYNFENTISQSLSPNLIRGRYLSTVDS